MNGTGTGIGIVSMTDTGNDSHLVGTIECDSNGYVMFPIPYEGGWSAVVDGQEVELVKADFGFMAFQVEAGNHDFELKFAPPLFKEGLIVSGICSLSAFALFLFGFLKTKKNTKDTGENHHN